MRFCLILLLGLLSFSSFGSRYFWKYSEDPGSLHYWKHGRDVGSRHFWLYGKEVGSQHFWKYERKLGSEYFWKYGIEAGSLHFWKYGSGPGSEHYWKYGDGPGSKQFWDYGHSASFFPYFVAICKAGAIDIAPCQAMNGENLQETLETFMNMNQGPNLPMNLLPAHIYGDELRKESAPHSNPKVRNSSSSQQ